MITQTGINSNTMPVRRDQDEQNLDIRGDARQQSVNVGFHIVRYEASQVSRRPTLLDSCRGLL